MLFKSLLALGAIQAAAAHTIFTNFYVNGVDQGDNGTAKCVRMNMTPDNASSPVEDLSSNNMACGFDGTVGVARVCGINKSDTITFQFRKWADGSQPGVIAKQHYGPGAVYMKKVDSAIEDPGYGDGWFKIWDDGYNNATGLWFTDKLIDAGGLLSVEIPADLAGGYYLLRPEVLALHQANVGDPQFYMGCAQVFLNSDATATPTETVSIPGYVKAGDPSVDFDIYVTPMPEYPLPGPTPYESAANINSNIAARDQPVQTEGLLPVGCILENANWCGIELDSYSTMDGCWNASDACWDQDTTCWDGAPTGGKNCPIWEQRCHDIQNACNSSDYNGPPNKGTWLTPPSNTISVELAASTGSSSSSYSSEEADYSTSAAPSSTEAPSSTYESSAEATSYSSYSYSSESSAEPTSETYSSMEASSTSAPETTSAAAYPSGEVVVTETDWVVVTTAVTVTETLGAEGTGYAKAKRHAHWADHKHAAGRF